MVENQFPSTPNQELSPLAKLTGLVIDRFNVEPSSYVDSYFHTDSEGEYFSSHVYTPPFYKENEPPILYAWGFATDARIISEFADKLALSTERRVVVVSEDRAKAMPKEQDTYPDFPELRRNASLLDIALNDLGLTDDGQKFDIVDHSMGATTSRLLSSQSQRNIRSIVDIAPAGQADPIGGKKLQIGGGVEGVRMAVAPWRKANIRGGARQLEFTGGNMARSFAQQAEIAEIDARPQSNILRRAGKKIGLLAMHSDAIIARSTILPGSVDTHEVIDADSTVHFKRDGSYDSVVEFHRPWAGHNEMFTNPDEVAKAAAQLLDSLNQEGESAPLSQDNERNQISEHELTDAEIRRLKIYTLLTRRIPHKIAKLVFSQPL